MATTTSRRYEGWTPSAQTRIYTRSSREQRDEYPRLPKSPSRSRPSPINIPSGQSPLLNVSLADERSSEESCEAFPLPEIVDSAATTSWPCRALPKQRQSPSSSTTPRTVSQCSTRQSEGSFGILDYYTGNRSPLLSPDLSSAPRIGTPVLGPAIEKSEFELPSIPADNKPLPVPPPTDTRAGAEKDFIPPHSISARPQQRSRSDTTKSYKLFPTTAQPALPPPQTPPNTSSHTAFHASHPPPHPSYHPPKEILTSSVRSRKDSATSFAGTRRVRILSSPTSSITYPHSSSPAYPNTSPPSTRWSDETITSPLVATTSGLRGSFGPLLASHEPRFESSEMRYPTSSFEDEDEEDESAPLRRKFLGRGRISVTESKGGRFDVKPPSLRRRMWGWLICGGC